MPLFVVPDVSHGPLERHSDWHVINSPKGNMTSMSHKNLHEISLSPSRRNIPDSWHQSTDHVETWQKHPRGEQPSTNQVPGIRTFSRPRSTTRSPSSSTPWPPSLAHLSFLHKRTITAMACHRHPSQRRVHSPSRRLPNHNPHDTAHHEPSFPPKILIYRPFRPRLSPRSTGHTRLLGIPHPSSICPKQRRTLSHTAAYLEDPT